MNEKIFEQINKKDFGNEDLRTEILVSGTDENFQELKDFYLKNGITEEKIYLFRYYARLRKSTIEQIENEQNERKKNNPMATEEELSLGAYIENIEPQVREAVLCIRKKGYNTFESGFTGEGDEQMISIMNGSFEGFSISEEQRKKLKSKGVEIEIEDKSITLSLEKEMTVPEIKKIWDEIAEALPDLGKPAEPNTISAGESFRKKVNNTRQ